MKPNMANMRPSSVLADLCYSNTLFVEYHCSKMFHFFSLISYASFAVTGPFVETFLENVFHCLVRTKKKH
jgi:hypothetical protein